MTGPEPKEDLAAKDAERQRRMAKYRLLHPVVKRVNRTPEQIVMDEFHEEGLREYRARAKAKKKLEQEESMRVIRAERKASRAFKKAYGLPMYEYPAPPPKPAFKPDMAKVAAALKRLDGEVLDAKPEQGIKLSLHRMSRLLDLAGR